MGESKAPMRRFYGLKRMLYRDDRPGLVAKLMNGFTAVLYSSGLLGRTRSVTLEVAGRTSGRALPFPVVLADLDGAWYAVAMLGTKANWVRNVRAADGAITVRGRGEHTPARLVEVPVDERAPILKRYLEVAPGGRPHVAVPVGAPLAQFEAAAADYPVFRLEGAAAVPSLPAPR